MSSRLKKKIVKSLGKLAMYTRIQTEFNLAK